jgi:hypothetical protein
MFALMMNHQLRPSQGGAGRHDQQYELNAESVQKKLAVIPHLANGALMKNTLAHFYPNLASSAYNSKRTAGPAVVPA